MGRQRPPSSASHRSSRTNARWASDPSAAGDRPRERIDAGEGGLEVGSVRNHIGIERQPAIFKVSAKGGPITKLHERPPLAAPFGITISDDGQRLFIADSSAETSEDRSDGKVFVMPAAGGVPIALPGTEGLAPGGVEVAGDTLYVTGKEDGRAGVFRIGLGGGNLSPLAAGDAFVDPSGVAVAKSGEVYVVDSGSASQAQALASVVKVTADGRAEVLLQGLAVGHPGGIALSSDDKTLFVSGLDATKGTDVVAKIDLASLKVEEITTKIGEFYESAGLHRARGTNVFAWAADGPSALLSACARGNDPPLRRARGSGMTRSPRLVGAALWLSLAIAPLLAGTDEPRHSARLAASVTAPPDPDGALSPKQRLALAKIDGTGLADRAVVAAQAAVRQNMQKDDLWIVLGRAWVRKARESSDPGFYLNADACASVVLDRDPEHAPALDLRRLVLLDGHEFEAARALAARVLAKHPDDPVAWGTMRTRSSSSVATTRRRRRRSGWSTSSRTSRLQPRLPSAVAAR